VCAVCVRFGWWHVRGTGARGDWQPESGGSASQSLWGSASECRALPVEPPPRAPEPAPTDCTHAPHAPHAPSPAALPLSPPAPHPALSAQPGSPCSSPSELQQSPPSSNAPRLLLRRPPLLPLPFHSPSSNGRPPGGSSPSPRHAPGWAAPLGLARCAHGAGWRHLP
jgi:hypothetical protein